MNIRNLSPYVLPRLLACLTATLVGTTHAQVTEVDRARLGVCPAGTEVRVESEARVVVVGELHGTEEFPRLAERILCGIASKDRTTILGLELDAKAMAALKSHIQDRAPTLPEYSLPGDGRGSEAMVRLYRAAWRLHEAGYRVLIDGFAVSTADIPPALTADEEFPRTQSEAFMARRVLYRLDAYPDARYVALVGSLHSYKTVGRAGDAEHRSMVQRMLPETSVHVVSARWHRGTAFNCMLETVRQTKEVVCRARQTDVDQAAAPADKVDQIVTLDEVHASTPYSTLTPVSQANQP